METTLHESEQKTASREPQNPYVLPAAIIIAGAMVASAVLYSRGLPQEAAALKGLRDATAETAAEPRALKNMRPVSAGEHLRGDPKAPVKIVEFSDLECPFCKRFHETMLEVMAEYGKQGKVAWVYRHFPLDSLHPKARKEAEATECAAEVGGNEKFWAYMDRLFEITPSNNGLDLIQLPQIAEQVGLDRKRFERCLGASDKFAPRIEADYQDAVASGGTGTPFSVVLAPDGRRIVISGAQPYPAVKQIIEAALDGNK